MVPTVLACVVLSLPPRAFFIFFGLRERYAHGLRAWLAHFPARQLKVILFERFYTGGIANSINDVTRFLGLPDADVTAPMGFEVWVPPLHS